MARTGSPSRQIRLTQFFEQVINILLRQHVGNNSKSLFSNLSCPNQRFCSFASPATESERSSRTRLA